MTPENDPFDRFDNDSDSSDEDYFAFVAWLSDRTVSELRVARDQPELQRDALCRYYQCGERANLTGSELVDFLGVSNSSFLERAGYTESEGGALMHLSDSLTLADIVRWSSANSGE